MKTYKIYKCTTGGTTEASIEASSLQDAMSKAKRAVKYRNIRNASINDVRIFLDDEQVACYHGIAQKWFIK